ILVGIDADRELIGIGGGLKDAETGSDGRGIDDVGAATELRAGKLAALHRVVPGGTGCAGHVLEYFAAALHRLEPSDITAGQPPDERNIHAADEADLAGLGG